MTSPIPSTCLSLLLAMAACAQTPDDGAHILVLIPDGTPAPASPPPARFDIQRKHIRSEQVHRRNGANLTVRTIEPIRLPDRKPAASPINRESPAAADWIERQETDHPEAIFSLMGATVHLLPDGNVRTLLHIWPQRGGQPSVFWSSADFRLLAPITRFAGDDGRERHLMLAWSIERTDAQTAASLPIPAIPSEGPGFTAIGNASEEALAVVRSLHGIYEKNHASLLAAYEGRERARIRREAEERKRPVRKKDIVLHTWATRPGANFRKGGDR